MFEIGQGSRPCGATLYQKWKFLIFRGRIPTPCGDWGEILHSQADSRARRSCKVWHESVQRVAPAGWKPWFWVCEWVLCGILPVIIIMHTEILSVHHSFLAAPQTWAPTVIADYKAIITSSRPRRVISCNIYTLGHMLVIWCSDAALDIKVLLMTVYHLPVQPLATSCCLPACCSYWPLDEKLRKHYENYINCDFNKLCGRPPQYSPALCKLTFDLLT